MDPVEITDTGTMASFAPKRSIDPFPNCFSIWPRVCSSARARSFSSMRFKLLSYSALIQWGRTKGESYVLSIAAKFAVATKSFALLDPVIGRFLGDDDVVHVALAKSSRGNADETRFALHLLDRT